MENIIDDSYFKRIQKVGLVQVIFNYLLTLLKFLGGFIGNSTSLINDGINSLGDVVTSQASLIASKASSKKADEEHQFGHAKIESLFCLIFSVVLICITSFIIYESISSLINKDYLTKNVDKLFIALIFGIIALLIKGFMFSYTYYRYKKTNSLLLKTQSFDHLGDSVSTLISLISIILMITIKNNNELKMIDDICSIVIGLIIIIGAFKILMENASLLIDKAPSKEIVEEIKKDILNNEEVLHIDAFRARLVGNRIFLEIEISLDGNLSLKESHDIAETLRIEILNKYKTVKHCFIHLNPLDHIDESDF